MPLLNRQRFPIVVIGEKNTGCSCEYTLRKQCEVEDVFQIHSPAHVLEFVLETERNGFSPLCDLFFHLPEAG